MSHIGEGTTGEFLRGIGTIGSASFSSSTITVAEGGTGSTSFSAGSVIFSDGSILTQDNANLFYDNTNNRLGIGIGTPLDTLHIAGAMELDHTSIVNDDHAIEIVCNANGFADVKAMDIDYITGALAAGEDEEAILVNIDQSLSTGGIVAGYLCLATSTGSAVVNGYETGININPIVHESGTFGNAEEILNIAVDVTAALNSGGAGAISGFVADNDTMTIGDSTQFGEMEIILTTPASGAGIDPLFEYSTGAGTYASFVPADGTNGFKNTGAILWDASTLAGWVIAASGRYEIRITRQRNVLATTPVLDELQISALTEYKWDKDGNVNLNSLTLTTPLVVSSGGSGRASHTAYAVICGGTTATGAQQSVASVGSAGQILMSNGAGMLPTWSTATYPATAGTSGKILVSDGTNIVSSTPTFPNASATTRKIIVSDGTNWTASTETYAVPGTSGNVLTSDGTNWTSAVPVVKWFGSISTGQGNPVDATTYNFIPGGTFIANTSSTNPGCRFYAPFACTITTVYGAFRVSGTLGTSENCTLYIRKNDATNTNISTTIQLTTADVTYNKTDLSISLVAGDYIGFGFTGPSWGTNPTSVGIALSFLT